MRDFDQTYRDYQANVRLHAVRRCRNGALDPEEVAQEAWLRIWQNWSLIGATEKPGGLIFRLLHQTASSMFKATRTRKRQGREIPVSEFDVAMPPQLTVAPTQDTTVDLKRVSERLDRIPERQRDVLVARLMGDSLSEVGERLGVSTERARQIETQARKRLLMRPVSRNS